MTNNMNVIPFKQRNTPQSPSLVDTAIAAIDDALRIQLATLKTTADKSNVLLVTFATICYMLFDLNIYQDPRTNLCNGVRELYVRWCRQGRR